MKLYGGDLAAQVALGLVPHPREGASFAGEEADKSPEHPALQQGIRAPLPDVVVDESTNWQERARCGSEGVDPETFFPEKGGSSPEAEQICGRCAVRNECLTYALTHDEVTGVWGGLSERRRQNLKKEQ